MISGLTEDSIGEHVGRAGSHDEFVVRKAAMHDIGPILALINGYAAEGRDAAADRAGGLGGHSRFLGDSGGGTAGGLRGAAFLYAVRLAEIRSLAVAEDAKTLGIGRRLIEALVREASGYSLDAVFAFTYVAEFFRKMGFQVVERGELPLKVWKDCVRCPKFQCCDEIAVMRFLRPESGRELCISTGRRKSHSLCNCRCYGRRNTAR